LALGARLGKKAANVVDERLPARPRPAAQDVLENLGDDLGPRVIVKLESVLSEIFEFTSLAIVRLITIIDRVLGVVEPLLGVIEPLLEQSDPLLEILDCVDDEVWLEPALTQCVKEIGYGVAWRYSVNFHGVQIPSEGEGRIALTPRFAPRGFCVLGGHHWQVAKPRFA
jgi:hypothetical protein